MTDSSEESMVDEATCAAEGCDSPRYARGFCRKHYHADRYQRMRTELLARQRERYDPALRSEQHKAYYARKADERRAYAAKYRQENPEKARAYVEAWVEANRDRKNAADRERWHSDPEAAKARHEAWYQANKDKSKEAWHRRRARKHGAKVTPVELRTILERDGMVCHLCGGGIESHADLHFDHVIPLAQGGAHSPDNIRPAHAFCNLSKGARLLS